MYKKMIFHQIYCPKCGLFYILKTIKGLCPVCNRKIRADYYKKSVANIDAVFVFEEPELEKEAVNINKLPKWYHLWEIEMQKRGQLTQRIKDRAVELLGYEISRTELRLMPYILSVMMNAQKIDPRRCNQDDRDILQKWKKAGHIIGGAGGLQITEAFWSIICDIVRLGYVDLD